MTDEQRAKLAAIAWSMSWVAGREATDQITRIELAQAVNDLSHQLMAIVQADEGGVTRKKLRRKKP